MNPSQGDQGLQGGWALDDKGEINFVHSLSSQFGYIQQAGAGWVRLNFRLGRCFDDWQSPASAPCVAANPALQGKTALDLYDQVVQAALGSNLQILGLLSNETWHGGQADWTENNAENAGGDGSNSWIDSFAQNTAILVARYPQITQWEVWNEPNAWTSNPNPGVYSGGTFIYPSNFAQLLAGSYAAIKNANASAVVISAGIFCHDRDRGTDYLQNTYRMGIDNAGWTAESFPLDAIGQHLYINQSGVTSSATLTSFLQDLRNAYLAYEGADSSKHTQITEVGWTTAQVSAAVQAQNLQIAFGTFQGIDFVDRAYWFSVQDIPEGHVYYGLVDGHGGPKPALAAYQANATY